MHAGDLVANHGEIEDFAKLFKDWAQVFLLHMLWNLSHK